MSKAGQRLLDAAHEVAAIARGEMQPARVHLPADIDVKAIRGALGLSQEDFASSFGFTVNQIRDWEQGRSRPIGGVRAYLTIIRTDPSSVRRLLEETHRTAA
ncbi:MAG: helix-turn-helix domain-containing protein [Salinarimonas sp.]